LAQFYDGITLDEKDNLLNKLKIDPKRGDVKSIGRFCGGKPKQAGKKAFTSIKKKCKDKVDITNGVVYTICECTRRGSKARKTYQAIPGFLKKPSYTVIGKPSNFPFDIVKNATTDEDVNSNKQRIAKRKEFDAEVISAYLLGSTKEEREK